MPPTKCRTAAAVLGRTTLALHPAPARASLLYPAFTTPAPINTTICKSRAFSSCLRRHHQDQHQNQQRLRRPDLTRSQSGRPRPHSPQLSSPASLLQRTRHYHSYEHPAPPGPYNSAQEAILSAAYQHVPSHGFSDTALALGARDAGYLDISTNILPDGPFDLIRWHLIQRREELGPRARELFSDGKGEGAGLCIADKVGKLAWERLMGNREVVGRWQEALAIMAQPSYVPASLKELALLADEIWFLAGDVSVDPSWYTKRASLSAIYAAAELFMTNDRSADFTETQQFLRRRFDEANELGAAAKSVGEWLGFTASAGVNVLRSKGLRI